MTLPSAPINLPRYTILFGPIGSGQKELASSLSDLDPSIAIVDLESPLRAATMELFWGGFEYELDLTDKAQLDASFPFPDPQNRVAEFGVHTNKDWIDAFRNGLRVNLGDDILARIALRETERMLIHHERIIFRDVQSKADLTTLCNAQPEGLIVSFAGTNNFFPSRTKSLVFLHSSDTTENLLTLRRELGDLP